MTPEYLKAQQASARMASSARHDQKGSWIHTLSVLAILAVALSSAAVFLETQLATGRFYVFSPPQLHDLSRRAIAAHGNDTASVVSFIVEELARTAPPGTVNQDEEWIFNNAGGAMGAMYIIHASASLP
jgi:C-8 sterol isomerase